MRKIFTLLAIVGSAYAVKAQSGFTPGNLVIYRVGKGDSTLKNFATPIYLDERSPLTGALVQSILLPQNDAAIAGTSNKVITASGTAGSEGLISRSADGKYLIVTGYNASTDTSKVPLNGTTSTLVRRVVGSINATGVVNTTTALSNVANKNNIRSATSADGSSFWIASAVGGVTYATLGADTALTTIASAPANVRAIGIVGNQLVATSSSSAAGRRVNIGVIGNGLPTKRANFVQLKGVDTTNGATPIASTNFYQFVVVDLAGSIVLYIADNGADSLPKRGIQKYSLNPTDSSWIYNGQIKATGIVGLTGGVVTGNTVALFGTSATKLYRVIDPTGYNAAPGIGDTAVVLASAPRNTAFRGITFAPGTVPVPVALRSFNAGLNKTNITLSWETASEINNKSFVIEKSVNGESFNAIATLEAKKKPSTYAFSDAQVLSVQYYRLKMLDNDGKFTYSDVKKVESKNIAKLEVAVNPVLNKLVLNHPVALDGAALKITNIEGKTIASYTVQSGTILSNIDVVRLSKGSYFVTYYNNGKASTVKFEK